MKFLVFLTNQYGKFLILNNIYLNKNNLYGSKYIEKYQISNATTFTCYDCKFEGAVMDP